MGETNNQNAVKHGADGALKRIQAQKPLIGLAADAEKQVEADLQTMGVSGIVARDARRLQCCVELYWNAVTKAAQDGDIEALDRYVARFGWLSGVALRAWDQVQKSERDAAKSGPNVIDVVNAMKGGDNG